MLLLSCSNSLTVFLEECYNVSAKLNVLFATNHAYLPQMTGGSESSTHELCLELMSRGHQVAVISALGKNDRIWFKNRLLSKVRRRSFIADQYSGYPVFRGWDVRTGIRQVLSEFQADVVVVQACRPFELLNVCADLHLPTVYYVRDIFFEHNSIPLRLSPFIGYVSNSHFTSRKLKEYLGVDSLVIPPLIYTDNYRVKEPGDKVVQIGLDPLKGVDVAYSLATSRPDIPFLLVESWPVPEVRFENYRRRADRLSNVMLSRRVRDMREVYAQARILLVPSQCEECWGRVVTEAQCSGIPVIASDVGGLPESVGPGGILVDKDRDIALWQQALSDLWDDEGRYQLMSSVAKKHSLREEISRSFLIKRFIDFLIQHKSSCMSYSFNKFT